MNNTVKADRVLCPLMTSPKYLSPCKREKCAWWDESLKCCAMRALSVGIWNVLDELRKAPRSRS